MKCADGRIEAEINWQVAPRGLFHRAESRFRHIAERNAGFRADGQKTFVVHASEIQAEAAKIVAQKNCAVHFGINRVSISVGERQPERERRQLVEVGHEAPALRQHRLQFEPLLMAALRYKYAIRVRQAAVNYGVIGIAKRCIFGWPQANFGTLGGAAVGIVLHANGCVGPGSGRPIIRVAENVTLGGTVADIGNSSTKGYVFGDAYYWAPTTWADATI